MPTTFLLNISELLKLSSFSNVRVKFNITIFLTVRVAVKFIVVPFEVPGEDHSNCADEDIQKIPDESRVFVYEKQENPEALGVGNELGGVPKTVPDVNLEKSENNMESIIH